ncbi:hypothetical protein Tco_1234931 [Tanacetum coccineum]
MAIHHSFKNAFCMDSLSETVYIITSCFQDPQHPESSALKDAMVLERPGFRALQSLTLPGLTSLMPVQQFWVLYA